MFAELCVSVTSRCLCGEVFSEIFHHRGAEAGTETRKELLLWPVFAATPSLTMRIFGPYDWLFERHGIFTTIYDYTR